MQITEIDRQSARLIATEMKNALKSFEQRFGLTIDVKAARIKGANTLGLDVTAALGDEIRLEETGPGRAFLTYAKSYGAEPEWLGRYFRTADGKLYQLVGLKTSRPKYPFDAVEAATERLFKFPKDIVVNALRR